MIKMTEVGVFWDDASTFNGPSGWWLLSGPS